MSTWNARFQIAVPFFPRWGVGRRAPSPSQRRPRPQSWGINCAQIAIIATKSAIDVSAAASSTNVFNIGYLRLLEHKKNIVPLLFTRSQEAEGWRSSASDPLVNSFKWPVFISEVAVFHPHKARIGHRLARILILGGLDETVIVS